MSTNSYVQVPPDGAGKKLYTQQHTIGADSVHGQVYHLADPSDPSHIQRVDAQGQANVRFAEGSPSMDAFGSLRVSNAVMIGSYDHTSDAMSDLFTDIVKGGGTITHYPFKSSLSLVTTDSATSYASRTTNRFHYYQPGVGTFIIITLGHGDSGKSGNVRVWGYGNKLNGLFFKLVGTTLYASLHTSVNSPLVTTTATGSNMSYTLTVADPEGITVGMTAVGEGVPVEALVTDVTLNVVTISHPLYADVSGTFSFSGYEMIDIPQSEWNGDRLDGTGLSGMTLDLTKSNFYWIDLAWLGVGTVRFGLLAEDGSRVVAHTLKNPNSIVGPYMFSGSRPLHFQNSNVAPTSGSSEMKLICSAVYSEATVNYTFWRYDDIERLTPVNVTTNTHVLSAKPKLFLPTGLPNRVGMYPDEIRVFVTGGNIKLSIVDDATLSAPTWTIPGDGSVKGDISDSTVTDGSYFKSWYLGPGSHNIDLKPFYELNDEGYHTLADSSDSYMFSLVATKLDGTTVTVASGLTYRELR